MRTMRSINVCLATALLAGCMPPRYGLETQLTLRDGTHPTWAVAPAVNLSGETGVDPILQADLVFHQLAAVNNLNVIPVDQVVKVYAALHITKVESEEQAAIVCEQLGCDALVIPTITVYDPYTPPKLGAALQILRRHPAGLNHNVDPRELSRLATPTEDQTLPSKPQFTQVVGMYDAINGSVHEAVLRYAQGRNNPCGPMKENEYFMNMDRYCEFVYYTLIEQMIRGVSGQPAETPPPPVQGPTASETIKNGLTALSE